MSALRTTILKLEGKEYVVKYRYYEGSPYDSINPEEYPEVDIHSIVDLEADKEVELTAQEENTLLLRIYKLEAERVEEMKELEADREL